jgi:hypothetical protein
MAREMTSLMPQARQSARRRDVGISTASILILIAATFAGTRTPYVMAVGIVVCFAFIAPRLTFAVSILWIILCRPGVELVQMSIGSYHFTEVDLLPILALVAALMIPKAENLPGYQIDFGAWFLLLCWPLWFATRFALPTIGNVAVTSAAVDARNGTMYVVLIPIAAYVIRRGPESAVRLLAYGGYLACMIAIVAWVLLMTRTLKPALTAFVYFYAWNDVRPGGEILVVMLAVLFLLGRAPLLLGSRVLSFILIGGELLVSQTLSMVVAIVLGVVAATIFQWRKISFSRKALASLIAVLFFAIAIGGIAPGSRFDLSARYDEASAEYRATEFDEVRTALMSSPLSIAVGNGPGASLPVLDVYTHQYQLKRDTHDTFANIALKSGIFGLFLYLLPLGYAIMRLLQAGGRDERTLAAVVVSIILLSVTVPFTWTASGLTALMLLVVASVTVTSQPHSGIASLGAPDWKSSR